MDDDLDGGGTNNDGGGGGNGGGDDDDDEEKEEAEMMVVVVMKKKKKKKKRKLFKRVFSGPALSPASGQARSGHSPLPTWQAIVLGGRSACLNFADSEWSLPIQASSDVKDIQRATAK
ncbi:hypothetical protein LguiA_024013 [Lonicera macranthoides]